ncbi:MAG: hypothetical protein LKJ80_06795 [Oscillibacter sp.]|jgi:hypothetical protein|nr:hypothetical protein [Oscillibacter sp.]
MTGFSYANHQNTAGCSASANTAEAAFSCANTTRSLRILDAIIVASILFTLGMIIVSLRSILSVAIIICLLGVSVLLEVLLITGKIKFAKDA